ncbi:MAG: sigma-70 family RNA polymerase sigma factor [Planctomycetes bacterium]|nr:sigma-70 family RNA polymerase sigma factor [Planctomycetota bacterium]
MRERTEAQERFLELLDAHQRVITRVARLYARDSAEREDLEQEIALAAWRSFEHYRGAAAFSTYLYRVALNTALMRVRKRYREPARADELDVERVPARAASHGAEDVERLHAAIRELSPLDRGLVLMVLDDRSHAEIAAVTGLSVGNVGVRLVRARARLRARLGTVEQEDRSCSTKN